MTAIVNTNAVEGDNVGGVSLDMSMLIVDDDDSFRDRLALAMEERGFEVVAASSVAEGLEAVAVKNPAFAIIDMRLADGNGVDVIASLKKQRSDARTIMLTGYGNALMALQHDTAAIPQYPMSPDRVRYDHIQDVFAYHDRNVSETARRLKMHRRTLQRILAKRAPR